MLLSLVDETANDAALIEDLECAHVQAARARSDEFAVRATLDECDVDAGERKLSGEHQPGRTRADDHDIVLFFHRCTSASKVGDAAPDDGAYRKRRARYTLNWEDEDARAYNRAVPQRDDAGSVSCHPATSAFERTSKRRRGYPSEQRVRKGDRVVHGNKELIREARAQRSVSVRLREVVSRTAACAAASSTDRIEITTNADSEGAARAPLFSATFSVRAQDST
jgi:hypothetical protein